MGWDWAIKGGMAGGAVGVVAGALAGYLFFRGFYPTCGHVGSLPCTSAGHAVTGESAEQLTWMTVLVTPFVATCAGAGAAFIVGKYRGATGGA